MTKSFAIAFVLALVIASSCAKKRDDQFAQGMGTSLEAVADYQGKTFSLTTKAPLSENDVSQSGVVKMEGEIAEMKVLPLVDYSTDADLLGSVPFRGKPEGHKYEIQYRVNDQFLYVEKVAPAADVDYREIALASSLKDGRVAIPLVGYPIKDFFRIEKKLNDDKEPTNTLIEVKASGVKDGTHMRIDYAGKKVFKAVTKIDIFPADLFSGDWYFSRTTIDASDRRKEEIGMNYDVMDIGLEQASKIRFVKNDQWLKAVNSSIDSRLDQKNEINYNEVMSIGLDWVDYKIKTQNGEGSFEEELDDKKPIDQRRFVRLKFSEIRLPTLGVNALSGEVVAQRKLVDQELRDIEIAPGYFSITTIDPTNQIRLKYSFLKTSNRGYTPRTYFKTDQKLFGYFLNIKPVILNYEIHRQEDVEKNMQISRFNPKNKEIVFHFSVNSSKNPTIRNAAKAAVESWNETFKKAGTGIAVRLNAEKEVSLGDLRFNVINLIESVSENFLYGLGPSVADPDTGEIISTTSNVHVSTMRSTLVRHLRNYIIFKTRLKGVISTPGSVLDILPHTQDAQPTNPVIAKQWRSFSEKVAAHPFKYFSSAEKKVRTEAKELKVVGPSGHCSAGPHISTSSITRRMEERCAQFLDYVNNLTEEHSSEELQMINGCADQLITEPLTHTLVHELGHNFGLRHNFFASADPSNFSTPEETQSKEQVQYSSIMDYPAGHSEDILRPGKYDAAAISFGYASKIELKNGALAEFSPEQALQKQKVFSSSRPYLYCEDWDVELGLDPMCARHDVGTTPEAVVTNMIQEFQNSYAFMNFRYDRYYSNSPNGLTETKIRRYFIPMKRFYDQWRFHLAEFVGSNNEYLEEFDEVAFSNILKRMSEDPRFSEKYKQYRPAAEKAFSFFKTLVFLPSEYCVLDQGDRPKVLELENLRKLLYKENDISIGGCKDPLIAQKFGLPIEQIYQLGFSLNSYRNSLNPKDLTEPLDVIGSFPDRANAMASLINRSLLSLHHQAKDFYPNFLDEPAFARELKQEISDRMLEGVKFSFLDLQALPEATQKKLDRHWPKFRLESDLAMIMAKFYEYGLEVPNKELSNELRGTPFRKVVTTNPQMAQAATASISIGGKHYLAMDAENKVTISLIERFHAVNQLKEASLRPANPEATKALIAFTQALPAGEEANKISVGQYMANLQALVGIIQQLPYAEILASTSTPLIQAFEVSDAIETKVRGTPDQNLRKQIVDAPIEKNPLAKEAFETLPAELENLEGVYREMGQTYSEDKTEFDAQMDLILKILSQ